MAARINSADSCGPEILDILGLVWKRLAYGMIGGWSAAALVMLSLRTLTGRFPMWPFLILGNTLAPAIVAWAERRGKVESIEQLHRPLTLFPRDHA